LEIACAQILHLPLQRAVARKLENLYPVPDSRPTAEIRQQEPDRKMGRALSRRSGSIGITMKPYENVRHGFAPAAATAERSRIYRNDELRRAFKRARTVENKAPADPTRARTTVGFSGESVQPVWACNGAAINRKSADQKRNCTDLFIFSSRPRQPIYWNKK
jgi:hypothetical protein